MRIAAAIHNKYGTRMYAYNDDASVSARILSRSNLTNKIEMFVQQKNLTRIRASFQDMNGSSIPEFPEIDLISLRTMVGSYHLALAASYYGDHISSESGYEIQVGKYDSFTSADFAQYEIEVEKPLFIRVKLMSRHTWSKIYQAYLLCDLNKSSIDSAIGFCCQCLQGLRTVSPCAHVSSIIWI